MTTFGAFRLLDTILSHQRGIRLTAECDPKSRRPLLDAMGEEAFLMELAAQTGALMNRLEATGFQDHFLGKIKTIAFHPRNGLSEPVVTSVARLEGNGRLTRYEGHSSSPSGVVLSSFDLLICTVPDLGGDAKRRSLYWRDHLARLPEGDCNT